MAVEKNKDAEVRRKSSRASASDAPAETIRKKTKGQAGPDLGNALRAAYQRTIDEQIPPDLLDLLGKLG